MEISEVNPDGNVYKLKDETARTEIAQIKAQDKYSTAEVKTVKTWIDNKPIYRKVVNFGALPNNGSKNVSHGISDLDFLISAEGIAYQTQGNVSIPLSNPGTGGSTTQLTVQGSNIRISTNFNASTYTTCYVILMYTKTTD